MTCKLIYVAGCNKSPPTFNVCTFPNYFYVLFVRVSVNVQPIMLELGLPLNLCALHTGEIDISCLLARGLACSPACGLACLMACGLAGNLHKLRNPGLASPILGAPAPTLNLHLELLQSWTGTNWTLDTNYTDLRPREYICYSELNKECCLP